MSIYHFSLRVKTVFNVSIKSKKLILCTSVVSFTPLPLYPGERVPSTHWVGGWVGSRIYLNAVEKRKILH
jgi:hypothetical protein